MEISSKRNEHQNLYDIGYNKTNPTFKKSALYGLKRAFCLNCVSDQKNYDELTSKEFFASQQKKDNENPLELIKNFQKKHKNQVKQYQSHTIETQLRSIRKNEIFLMLENKPEKKSTIKNKTLSELSNKINSNSYNIGKKTTLTVGNKQSSTIKALELMKNKLQNNMKKERKGMIMFNKSQNTKLF